MLRGRKAYVVGANEAEGVLLAARTEPRDPADPSRGITLFLVDPEADGVTLVENQINVRVLREEEHMSITGDVFFEVGLDGVAVSADDVLGTTGEGGVIVRELATRMMLMIAGTAVGWGDRILARSVEYANGRVIFEDPIGAYQAIQHPMVRAKTDVEMAKLLIERAVDVAGRDDADETQVVAGVAKYAASEAAYAACDIGIQTHGGGGFDTETGIITLWPLILLSRMVPLGSETLLEDFARSAFDIGAAA